MIRTALLFLICAVPSTALDLATTEMARLRGGFMELHPAGFVPLSENILDDAVKLLIGTAVVLFGACLRKDALREASSVSFEEFDEQLFAERGWAAFLILMPCIIGILRFKPVMTNTFNLTLGWCPSHRFLLDPLQGLIGNLTIAYMATIGLIFLALFYPITRLVLRMLYYVHRWKTKEIG